MAILVMKFGGASVGSTTALTQVLSIVLQEHEHWDHLLLVVSALDGVTDALIEAAQLAQLSNRRGYRRIVATLRTRHLALVEQLPLGTNERQALQADIDRLLFDMLGVCQDLANRPAREPKSAAFDEIIGVGERLSARIVATLLRQNHLRGVAIDATDVLVTDADYGHAHPNLELTRVRMNQHLMPMLSRDIIPVVTGFIGATETGRPTTLGRGGSDYTASILAVCADAKEVWMWTDVDGIMTTDPQEIPDAQNIDELSYEEVAELAYFGARILHARMIGPLREHQINLRVKNIFKPRDPGTLVHAMPPDQSRTIKAVTIIQGLSLTAEYNGPLVKITALIDQALHTTTGNHTEVMISAQSSLRTFLCFIIPTTIGPEALRATQNNLDRCLQEVGLHTTWSVEPVSVITVVGADLARLSGDTARILDALGDLNVLALSEGPSGHNLSIVVTIGDGEIALGKIHSAILNND
ncbi:MAG: aspartate kinase [Anaerolineae bacterium]|nr:aspartate kinase [Anaerolineae bacterium]